MTDAEKQGIADELLGQRVKLISINQSESSHRVFGEKIGTISDVGSVRCYLNYGTDKEFSAPWKMIKSINPVR